MVGSIVGVLTIVSVGVIYGVFSTVTGGCVVAIVGISGIGVFEGCIKVWVSIGNSDVPIG